MVVGVFYVYVIVLLWWLVDCFGLVICEVFVVGVVVFDWVCMVLLIFFVEMVYSVSVFGELDCWVFDVVEVVVFVLCVGESFDGVVIV